MRDSRAVDALVREYHPQIEAYRRAVSVLNRLPLAAVRARLLS